MKLYGIECPKDNQPWGNTAKAGLIKMINNIQINVEEHGIDELDRTLATLYIWNNEKGQWMNVNERMVTLGHAWVNKNKCDKLPEFRQDRLNKTEEWAKKNKVGLWKTENPIAPWEWQENSDA